MMGGISGHKVHAITVRNSDGSLLFEADINNDANAETIILTHPSNRYEDGIRAGNYVIEKLNDNTYYINPRHMSDIDRRLAELMDD
jgi:hypothetical protein